MQRIRFEDHGVGRKRRIEKEDIRVPFNNIIMSSDTKWTQWVVEF